MGSVGPSETGGELRPTLLKRISVPRATLPPVSDRSCRPAGPGADELGSTPTVTTAKVNTAVPGSRWPPNALPGLARLMCGCNWPFSTYTLPRMSRTASADLREHVLRRKRPVAHLVHLVTAHRTESRQDYGVADLVLLHHVFKARQQVGVVLETENQHALELRRDGQDIRHRGAVRPGVGGGPTSWSPRGGSPGRPGQAKQGGDPGQLAHNQQSQNAASTGSRPAVAAACESAKPFVSTARTCRPARACSPSRTPSWASPGSSCSTRARSVRWAATCAAAGSYHRRRVSRPCSSTPPATA